MYDTDIHKSFREKIQESLKSRGYVVVPGVVSEDECDKYISDYRVWVDKFAEEPPHWRKSLIQQYRVSHSDPTWRVRLRAKPVFAKIWETEKLFCSMDGIAIGEPPELGRTPFSKSGDNWFHIDQGSWRDGLHVYQGAVYLEETTEEDHCFRVMEGSPNYHKEFLSTFEDAYKESAGEDFYILKEEHKEFYRSKGCKEKKVPVPKGGLVLWDSRTVHDNIAPMEGRKHSDRWRYVVFVCMAPAIWASESEVALKRQAYENMVATAHWPSQGVWLFPNTENCKHTQNKPKIEMVEEHPDIAKSKEVLLMAGMDKYDFNNGESNGPGWEPQWNTDRFSKVRSSPFFS